jgi:hypothetical protein|tara:strand:- start:634 stop:870 length:237 start_codon:yes stop_codon:yes gene_type:complete
VQLGDAFLCELIAEVAESCVTTALPPERTAMLEGVNPADLAHVTPVLKEMLNLESKCAELSTAKTREVKPGVCAMGRV